LRKATTAIGLCDTIIRVVSTSGNSDRKSEERLVMLGSHSHPLENSTHLKLEGLHYTMDLCKWVKHFCCWGSFIITTKLFLYWQCFILKLPFHYSF